MPRPKKSRVGTRRSTAATTQNAIAAFVTKHYGPDFDVVDALIRGPKFDDPQASALTAERRKMYAEEIRARTTLPTSYQWRIVDQGAYSPTLGDVAALTRDGHVTLVRDGEVWDAGSNFNCCGQGSHENYVIAAILSAERFLVMPGGLGLQVERVRNEADPKFDSLGIVGVFQIAKGKHGMRTIAKGEPMLTPWYAKN